VTAAVAITATVVVLAGLGVVLWRATRPPMVAATAPPDSWGLDPDDGRWEQQAGELLHQSLPKLQEAARPCFVMLGAIEDYSECFWG
jgi:hypothetical protein